MELGGVDFLVISFCWSKTEKESISFFTVVDIIVKCINLIPPKFQTKIRVDFNQPQRSLEIWNPRLTQKRFPFIGFIILKTSNFSSRFL